uniref:Uncharacterized protein n=1 Tax=Anopheles atroparvus TaxID=41427 RepID=A0A182JJA1_ANOAO
MPIDKRGVRDVGVTVDGKFIEIPEKIPELIVPNLEGCKLKPYVSYKAPDVVQSEFTMDLIGDDFFDDCELLSLSLERLLLVLLDDDELELLDVRR